MSIATSRSGLRTTVLVSLAWPALALAQLAPDWSASVEAQGIPPALAVDGAGNSLVVATRTAQPVMVHKFGPGGALLWQHSLAEAGVAGRAFDAVADAGGQVVIAGTVPVAGIVHGSFATCGIGVRGAPRLGIATVVVWPPVVIFDKKIDE